MKFTSENSKITIESDPWKHDLFVGDVNEDSNGSTENENTYLKLFCNNTLQNQYLIKGTGLTSVTSDSNGNVTISTPKHASLENWEDTRDEATKPNDYNGAFVVKGIKIASSVLGLSGDKSGYYATVLGWRGWSDNSGGYAWELASTDKNRLYVRSGDTT